MKKSISSLGVSVALTSLIAYGVVTNLACSDDDSGDINVVTGRGGNGGGAGRAGGGGAGGGGGSDGIIAAYTVSLSAADEVPSNPSGGSGSVVVTLRPSKGSVSVVGTFRGLSSDAKAAEIRGPAGVGENGPVILTLSATGGTVGAISGSGDISSDMVTAMQNGQTYVNITTTTYPDGELRGQITP
jgi:hypothetical protein